MVRLIRASLRSSAAFGAILLTTVLAVSSVQGAECTSSDASVQSAYKLEGPATASAAVHASPPLRGVALGDWIGVEIEALPKLLDEAKCRNKSIIPVLNGRSFTEMTIFGPSTKDSNVIFFRLLRTSAQRSLWAELLGSPGFEPRKVSVTLRMEGEIPLPANSSSTVLDLEVVNGWSLAGALTCFFALLAAFLLLANRTNIMRDAAPPDYAVPIVNGELSPTKPTANRGPYSLSRLQGAWWFFIILGMYLLIGVVTWDFSASISSTAVILLGIGAGTVVGAAVIDISQDTPEQQATREQRATELSVQIERLSKTIDAFTFASLEAKRLGGDKLISYDESKRSNLNALAGLDPIDWLLQEATALGDPPPLIAERIELARLEATPPGAGTPGETRLATLKGRYPGARATELRALVPKTSELTEKRLMAISRYRKLTNQSEWWFIDVISDVNGVSFRRFQLFAWTIVLGAVFSVTSYRELMMPVFDTTLIGLLGLSAGTYLGLKIPEPAVPK